MEWGGSAVVALLLGLFFCYSLCFNAFLFSHRSVILSDCRCDLHPVLLEFLDEMDLLPELVGSVV